MQAKEVSGFFFISLIFDWLMVGCLGDDLSGLVDDSGVEEGGDALPEGIYNVPRNMLIGDTPLIDPSGSNGNIPIAGGIYDVPRSLLGITRHIRCFACLFINFLYIYIYIFFFAGENNQIIVGSQGMEFQMTGNPFDIYDVPRSTMDPSYDDDTIYDYPLDFDLEDMEIYDYPPDAAQLGEFPSL